MNARMGALILPLVALAVFVRGLNAQPSSSNQPKVTITDLGVLPSLPDYLNAVSAYAINNAGVVVGVSSAPTFRGCVDFQFLPREHHAFQWSPATGMQDLGVLANSCYSEADTINDAGFIAGYSTQLSGLIGLVDKAHLWTPGNVFPFALGVAPLPQCQVPAPQYGCGTRAVGLSPTGDIVVGNYHGSPGLAPAGSFLWQATTGIMQLMGLPAGAHVYGMNSLGAIACSHPVAGGGSVACLRKPDGSLVDLANDGGFCTGFAINDNNELAGYCFPPNGESDIAMFWDKNGIGHALGVNGVALGINSSGSVVGVNEDTGVGFVWSSRTGVVDLGTLLPPGSGWTFVGTAYGINDNDQIVGQGMHNGQQRAFLLDIGPCFSAGGDSDGDGLCDDWETNGLTINVNGTPVFLDLPAMGADPLHKDVFVQLDTVGLNAVVPQISLDAVIIAFARAPVSNPDGTTGINLHVDDGPDSKMDPRNGLTWGALSKKSYLTDIQNLGNFAPNGPYATFPALFDVEKKLHFPPERVPVFHYAISELGPILKADGKTPAADGVARDVPSSDFIVSPSPGSLEPYVGSVFMHELGHNLGLDHGGADGINGKPNYFSIMNYIFTYDGLIPADRNLAPEYDYSRFGAEAAPLDPDSSDPANRLPVLDEDHLNETTGLGTPDFPVGANVLAYLSLRVCGPGGNPQLIEHLNGPIDWDCDAPAPDTDTDVPVDVNGDTQITMLAPHDDRGNLIFNGGQIGGLAKPSVAQGRGIIEPTPDQVQKIGAFWQAQRQRDNIPPVTTASLSPQPNAAGWNNTDVSVTLASTDNEAGGTGVKQVTYSATGAQSIASTVVNGASATFVISSEGITTITFFGTDNAGNIESAKMLTIQLDKSPPIITPQVSPLPNANGWNNTNVTVSFQCVDSLSGLAAGSPPAATTLTVEGAGQSVTGTCADAAGNSASATVSGINIDKTPPTVACSASPNILWPPNNKLVPINLSVTVTDSLSGAAGFTLVSVTSNEPDSGQGDIQGFTPGAASTDGQLRAQRLGSGTGRLYTFTYSGSDRAGNLASCTTTVVVPHDQGQ